MAKTEKEKKAKKHAQPLSRFLTKKSTKEEPLFSHFCEISIGSYRTAAETWARFDLAGREGDGAPLTTKREPFAKRSREKKSKKTRSATLAFFVMKFQESLATFFADLCNLYRKLSSGCRGASPF